MSCHCVGVKKNNNFSLQFCINSIKQVQQIGQVSALYCENAAAQLRLSKKEKDGAKEEMTDNRISANFQLVSLSCVTAFYQ